MICNGWSLVQMIFNSYKLIKHNKNTFDFIDLHRCAAKSESYNTSCCVRCDIYMNNSFLAQTEKNVGCSWHYFLKHIAHFSFCTAMHQHNFLGTLELNDLAEFNLVSNFNKICIQLTSLPGNFLMICYPFRLNFRY